MNMKWIAAAAGLIMMATVHAPGRKGVYGPQVVYIGPAGTAGAVRVINCNPDGVNGPIAYDAHTKATGTKVLDIATSDNSELFDFTLEYDATAPATFDIEIYESNGKPAKSDRKAEFNKATIAVKRQ